MARAKQAESAGPHISPICQMKVTLSGTRPPIGRRLLVPADFTLARLHTVLQIAFGWNDDHLHGFRIGRQLYGPPEPDALFGMPETISESTTLVGEVLGKVGAKAIYT